MISYPKGNHPWISNGRTDTEDEVPVFWPPDTHWKRPWCRERLRAGGEGVTENEMVGWHHQLDGLEFEQTAADSEGQGSLVCCSPWKESEVAQSCQALCDPMDCSLSGFSTCGVFQARTLEWIAISFSRGSSMGSQRIRNDLGTRL